MTNVPPSGPPSGPQGPPSLPPPSGPQGPPSLPPPSGPQGPPSLPPPTQAIPVAAPAPAPPPAPPPPPAAPSTAPPGPPTGTGGRPRWLPFAALAVVVAVVAGVFLVRGGSGSALSKAEFIKQGDAVCAALDDEIVGVDDGMSAYLTAFIPLAKKARADFAALTAPADGEDVQQALLDSLDVLLASVNKAIAADDDGDFEKMLTLLDDASAAIDEAEAAATKYGFKDCGTIL